MKKLLIIYFPAFLLVIIIFYVFVTRNGTNNSKENKAAEVYVRKTLNGFDLIRNNEPFYIKGAGGNSHLKELREIGGNTIRLYDTLNINQLLDEAYQNKLAVIVDIFIPRFQTDYNPYSISENNDTLKQNVINFVKKHKTHPAILFWNLGNEIDYPTLLKKSKRIPTITDLTNIFKVIKERKSFIKTFNELIEMIKSEDPNHPVGSCVSTDNFWKRVLSLHLNSPKLDIIGFNIFAPPLKFRNHINKLSHFIKIKPYYISEWGMEGPWAQEKTSWEAPIETTSTNKGNQYEYNYKLFESLFSESVGTVVFHWGQKQERTHTWFNIFDEQGRKNQIYYELRNIWKNRSDTLDFPPQIKYMVLDKKGARDNLVFLPNEIVEAEVLFNNEIDSSLNYNWEIFEEEWYYEGGGKKHLLPEKINGCFINIKNSVAKVKIPSVEGPYRIFVNVYDSFGNLSTANTPFYVLDRK